MSRPSYDLCQGCGRPLPRCKCPGFVDELQREIEVLQLEVARLTADNDRLNARDGNPRALKMPMLQGDSERGVTRMPVEDAAAGSRGPT